MEFKINYNNGYFIFIILNGIDEYRMKQLRRYDTDFYVNKFYEKAKLAHFNIGLVEQTESGQYYFPVEGSIIKCKSNYLKIKSICYSIDSLIDTDCKINNVLNALHNNIVHLYTDSNSNKYAFITKSPNGIVGVCTKFKYLVSSETYDNVRSYVKSFIPLIDIKYNNFCNVCNLEIDDEDIVYYVPYINKIMCEDCGDDFFSQDFRTVGADTEKDLKLCREILLYILEHMDNKQIINN